jgi:hypothetical protein
MKQSVVVGQYGAAAVAVTPISVNHLSAWHTTILLDMSYWMQLYSTENPV